MSFGLRYSAHPTNRPRLQRGRIKFAFVTQQTLFHFMIALIHSLIQPYFFDCTDVIFYLVLIACFFHERFGAFVAFFFGFFKILAGANFIVLLKLYLRS